MVDKHCSDLSYDEDAPAGKQRWLFILTSPAISGPYQLTTEFDPNWQNPGNTIEGVKKVSGAVHFTVDTEVGAQLLSASAVAGTGVSVLTVSHCIHSVKPLEVSKTAETSYTRSWDWDIEKTGSSEEEVETDLEKTTDLGTMEGEETANVTYKITLSATDTDSDYVVEGDITIKNPEDNPPATIGSIIDELDLSGGVAVTCLDELSFELSAGEEVTCTYSMEVEHDEDSLNTVTVNATIGGFNHDYEATASINWVEAEVSEVDECVTLSDTNSMFMDEGV